MANQITWTKQCRDYAKAHGRSLVAFGGDGIQMTGSTDKERAKVIGLLYVCYICNEMTFAAALAKVRKAYPDFKI